MEDKEKSKEQLMTEVQELRRLVTQLENHMTKPSLGLNLHSNRWPSKKPPDLGDKTNNRRDGHWNQPNTIHFKSLGDDLKNDDDRCRLLLGAIPDPVVVYDPQGRVIYANDAFVEKYGWTREELSDRRIDFVPSDELEITGESVAANRRGEDVSFETKRLTKDGRLLDVYITSAVVCDRAGNTLASFIIHRDITERKRAEVELKKYRDLLEDLVRIRTSDLVKKNRQLQLDIVRRQKAEAALRESEEKYRTIIENIEDSYYEVDLDGNLSFFNEALCRILGYDKMELLGKNKRDLCDKENAARLNKIYQQVLATETPAKAVHWEAINKDGSRHHIESSVSLVRGPNGQAKGFRGIARDVTERRQVEEALRKSEVQYQTVEANPDPVVIFDIEGKVVYLNPAFTRVFGWALEEVEGERIDFFVTLEERPNTSRIESKVMAGESFSGIESTHLTKAGKVIAVGISGATLTDKDGKPAGSIVALRDITVQKRIEAQLFQIEKMEAIRILVGGVAHELKNKLTSILGNSDYLTMLTDNEEILESAREIKKSVDESVQKIDGLLAFSLEQELKQEPVNLNETISEVARDLRTKLDNSVDLVMLYEEGIDPVFADPTLIRQSIMNLALNSIDALSKKGEGTLTISTENIAITGGLCGGVAEARPRKFVAVSVADTGAGIDPEIIHHIFEPFYTSKGFGGIGMGLSFGYGVVRQHGGWIEVESQVGQGTTFKVYLPAYEAAEEVKKNDQDRECISLV
ncbi:MAG: PAS domain S-box protein [Deltaproteobacteria bacterium]|nr:PAS domain S-box protein [Deltaproteobacteria bacterium]